MKRFRSVIAAMLIASGLAGCSTVPAAATIEGAVVGFYGMEGGPARPVFLGASNGYCEDDAIAGSLPIFDMGDPAVFPTKYPHGVYVICSMKTGDAYASSDVFGFLFHRASGKVLNNERATLFLKKERRGWRVVDGERTAIDYGPHPDNP